MKGGTEIVSTIGLGKKWIEGPANRLPGVRQRGGLLVQAAGAPFTLHAAAAHSREGTRVYVGIGYPF